MGDVDDSEAHVENVPDEDLIDEPPFQPEYESVPPNIFQYIWHCKYCTKTHDRTRTAILTDQTPFLAKDFLRRNYSASLRTFIFLK